LLICCYGIGMLIALCAQVCFFPLWLVLLIASWSILQHVHAKLQYKSTVDNACTHNFKSADD